jgi:hypothetical protein
MKIHLGLGSGFKQEQSSGGCEKEVIRNSVRPSIGIRAMDSIPRNFIKLF